MNPSEMEPSRASTCTTCTYSEDFSNYWTASLYFRSPENGSFKLVPQRPNFVGMDGVRHPVGGGITVYYMTSVFGSTSGNGKVTAFPPVSFPFKILRLKSSSLTGVSGLQNARRLARHHVKRPYLPRHLPPLQWQHDRIHPVRLC